MRFYEQVCDGRVVICADLVAKDDGTDRVMRDVDADCWIDAKRKFGYYLSAIQEMLLGKFYAKQRGE